MIPEPPPSMRSSSSNPSAPTLGQSIHLQKGESSRGFRRDKGLSQYQGGLKDSVLTLHSLRKRQPLGKYLPIPKGQGHSIEPEQLPQRVGSIFRKIYLILCSLLIST